MPRTNRGQRFARVASPNTQTEDNAPPEPQCRAQIEGKTLRQKRNGRTREPSANRSARTAMPRTNRGQRSARAARPGANRGQIARQSRKPNRLRTIEELTGSDLWPVKSCYARRQQAEPARPADSALSETCPAPTYGRAGRVLLRGSKWKPHCGGQSPLAARLQIVL